MNPITTTQKPLHDSPQTTEPFDWSAWYLTEEEDMGQNALQHDCITLLESVIKRYLHQQGWQDMKVGADLFFAWVKGEPKVQISPDIYVISPGLPQSDIGAVQTWRPGHNPPLLAVEIVSEDWKKDYDLNPKKYSQLGVEELIIFDPWASLKPNPKRKSRRVPLQFYSRSADGLVLRNPDDPRHHFSEVLRAWFVIISTTDGPRLRIASDPEGTDLYPSHEEAEVAAMRELAELKARLKSLTPES